MKTLVLDLYEPGGEAALGLRPGFIAVHGGGLSRGDKQDENMSQLCRELATRGYVCASINYRLRGDDPPAEGSSPDHPVLAAAVADAGRAVRWLHDQAARHHVDPRRIAAGGSSAGATIALRLAYGGQSRDLPVRAILAWSGDLDAPYDVIEPGEAAVFIVHGAEDALVEAASAREVARRARQVGLPHEIHLCEGLGHTVPLDRRPGGVSLYRRLALFLRATMDLSHLGQPIRGSLAPEPSDAPAEILPVPCPR